jgi:hypothetical protein
MVHEEWIFSDLWLLINLPEKTTTRFRINDENDFSKTLFKLSGNAPSNCRTTDFIIVIHSNLIIYYALIYF